MIAVSAQTISVLFVTRLYIYSAAVSGCVLIRLGNNKKEEDQQKNLKLKELKLFGGFEIIVDFLNLESIF